MRRSGLWLWITVWVCTAAVAQPHNSLSPREQRFGWKLLFNGNDLWGWTVASSPEAWRVEDGTIYCTGKGRGFLYSNEQYKNFVLRLDFKMSPNANSGVFVRIWDRNDPVNTGMEIQILDSYGRPNPGKHDCGALYDIVAPLKNAARPAGEWNSLSICCRDSHLMAFMNGEKIVDVNLSQWTEAGKNPDGTPNKFKYAYREMVKPGYIGLQNHGHQVWFRNVKIRPLY
jgi:hypothetical protein